MIEQLKKRWPEILEYVRTEHEVANASFSTWLLPLEVHSADDTTVYLTVDDSKKDRIRMITKKYSIPLGVAISDLITPDRDTPYDIQVYTRSEMAGLTGSGHTNGSGNGHTDDASSSEKGSSAIRSSVGMPIKPEYTFDTFIVGKNNDLAYATALAVATDPGDYANPLFIYGGVGLGKTHLMHSIANFAMQENPNYKILYTTTENFSRDLITKIQTRSTESFKNKYRDVDMLLIDDIQFIAGKDSTMEEFFHTFNALFDNNKQIVLTADKPPMEIMGLEQRLISRFQMGVTVDIQAPDFDTRLAILDDRIKSANLNVTHQAQEFIANNIVSNIRELEGAVRQIANYKKLTGTEEFDLDKVTDVLKGLIHAENTPQLITPMLIMNTVVEHYGNKFTIQDLQGKSKKKEVAYPRQICMYLCSKYTDLSLAAIGNEIGGRDHTTIMHGIEKITNDLKRDSQLEIVVNVIRNKLNPPK